MSKEIFMRYFKPLFRSAFALFSAMLSACPLVGMEVSVLTAKGEEAVLELCGEETLRSVIDMVYGYTEANGVVRFEFIVQDGEISLKALECSKAPPRNYYASVSAQEKKDLTYILKTLANNSLIKIGKEKSNIKKAGDRIENLHPFKFLEAVFTDEELKVCIRNLQGKGWVWSEFKEGITNSLAKESAVDNLKPEYIFNFAKTVNVDPNVIFSNIQEKNWSKLLTDLIALVPRNGDSNRYNM